MIETTEDFPNPPAVVRSSKARMPHALLLPPNLTCFLSLSALGPSRVKPFPCLYVLYLSSLLSCGIQQSQNAHATHGHPAPSQGPTISGRVHIGEPPKFPIATTSRELAGRRYISKPLLHPVERTGTQILAECRPAPETDLITACLSTYKPTPPHQLPCLYARRKGLAEVGSHKTVVWPFALRGLVLRPRLRCICDVRRYGPILSLGDELNSQPSPAFGKDGTLIAHALGSLYCNDMNKAGRMPRATSPVENAVHRAQLPGFSKAEPVVRYPVITAG